MRRNIDNRIFLRLISICSFFLLIVLIQVIFADYKNFQTNASETGWVVDNTVACNFPNRDTIWIGFTGEFASGDPVIARGYFTFDTSQIPVDATILETKLYIYCTVKNRASRAI